MKYSRLLAVFLLCVCLTFGGCGVRSADVPITENAVFTATNREDDRSATSVLGAFRIDGSPNETTDSDASESETTVNAASTFVPSSASASDESTAAATTSASSTAAASSTITHSTAASASSSPKQINTSEIRAVWVSYLDLSFLSRDRSEKAFRNNAKEMTRKMRDGKMNTVFLQVRPASDAMYRSSLFPYSAYISGVEGKDPGYDALKILCDYANEYGLSVHAWINPFRVGDASKFDQKAASNPAKRILTDDDPNNDNRIVRVNGSLYYDPADAENQELILAGVRELLQNYAISGIHIDDYFYPSSDTSIDQKDYDVYLAQGGMETRDNWRRTQINALVGRMYTCVKSFGQEKIFSISPSMEIEKNRSTLYADVTRWAEYGGYCDWLIPQIYVGLAHQTHPFRETVRAWTSLKRAGSVRLLVGLAAYKCGTEDTYAGSGSKEWIQNTDILSRQISYLRESDACSGFALFSYAYVFGEKMSNNSVLEIRNVIDML